METKSVATAKWLGRLSEGSVRSYRPTLNRFMTYVRESGGPFGEMTPDDLIQYQRDSDNGNKFEILDLLQAWIGTMESRQSSKATAYGIIRSFFAHNRVELPNDPSFIIRGDQEKVVGLLTIGNIRDMALSASRCYRAIFISIFQGGMDTSSLIYWSENGLESLKKQLRDDPEIIKINLPGRKRRRNKEPFYTLIGQDAIEALKAWMEVRPSGHKQIFLTQAFEDKENGIRKPVSYKSVRMYWLKHLEKIGLITRNGGSRSTRYGLNLHEIRDVFRSQWEKSPAKGSVAEFMMGHQVDPLEYNKACRDETWTRKEYKKALPLLQIMSSGRPYGQIEEDELEKRDTEIKNLQNRIQELDAQLKIEGRKKIETDIEFRDLAEQVRRMVPAFEMTQKFIEKDRELERLGAAAKESEDARAKGG